MNRPAKRALDVTVSATALAVLSPLLLLITVAVRLTMGKPILFRQVRPGYGARPFTVLKFRTMNEARDPSGELLPDADRLTRIGRFLRRTSLDELPQLWNVLSGHMSLVGPRPLLMEYVEHYTPEQARRHEVKPGITGWAQVNGRQDLPFSRRLALDVWYVDHQSFWLDLRIVARTALKMLFGSGVRSGQDVRQVDDLGLHPAVRGQGTRDD
ncbi:MAG: sugar transferase [Terriglobales bacterium]